jgi:hypothetical protein
MGGILILEAADKGRIDEKAKILGGSTAYLPEISI